MPLDGSPLAEYALPYARYMGHYFKLPVRVLSCMAGMPGPQPGTVKLQDLIRGYLERVSEPLRGAGLAVSTLLSPAEAATGIVDEVDQHAGTLLVMSAHGRTGIRRWALGSVTDRVLRASRSAMLIVRSDGEAAPAEVKLATIVVPLDGSELAEQALAPAILLARKAGLGLILLRVLSSEIQSYLQDPSFAGAWRDMAEETEANGEEYLQTVTARVRGEGVDRVQSKLLHGAPAEIIVDFVRDTPGCMVAMTTHGRSGIGRWVVGSVAERVARHSPRPVLLLRAHDTPA